MIVIRMTAGFANAIMKYCAAYALSRELNDEEIVLDVAPCQNSAWGYLVDYLNIPDYRKITYYTRDAQDLSSIPEEITEGADIIKIPQYPNIRHADKLRSSANDLYLDDWFMDQLNYYDGYMDELRPLLTYKGESRNIEAFKDLIKGRTSIGVHFRRTDMLFADFAQTTEDDYYKAAIEYCKARIDKNALFCVFGDDIQYAENLLGRGKNIRYIHFVGYDDADVEEFICLSLCDHRIRPKTSSYSDLADRINGKKDRKCILQGELESISVARRISRWKRWTKRRILTTLFADRYPEMQEELRRHDFCINNYRELNRKDIDRFSPGFIRKEGSRQDDLKRILNYKATADNARSILNEMREYELNYMTPEQDDEIFYRFIKFQCLCYENDYERAVGLGDHIWGSMIANDAFRTAYSDVLLRSGIERESKLVSDPIRKATFILISDVSSVYSSCLYGLGELAVGLAKMGAGVISVQNPADDTEKIYLRDHEYLTNRHEVNLGCRQFSYDQVKERGLISFISEEISDNEEKYIVIAREPDVFADKAANVCYIWMDDKDEYDPERSYHERYSDKTGFMAEQADYILTSHSEVYADKYAAKLIPYENKTYQEPYWSTRKRWMQHDCHRLSERTINMCFAVKRWFEMVSKEKDI